MANELMSFERTELLNIFETEEDMHMPKKN